MNKQTYFSRARNKKLTFSGIQPTGNLHIGNYIGAIKQWRAMQEKNDCFFCIVDLHAITVPKDPNVLKERISELAALYIASGIDPEKSVIFIQSRNPDHASLTWVLDCIASMGQLKRMTQYKVKSVKLKGEASVGLFNYPVLMASDILLYQTDEVPVGEDQRQHVELTRDLAQRFNSRFGPVFKLPQVKIFKIGAKIMSLQNPGGKMSKSDEDPNGTIDLLDSPDEVRRKVKIAVTDSGREIVFREDKPAISNLLTIYSHLGDLPIEKIEEKYADKGYKEFKEDLAEVIINSLKPIQEKYQKIKQEKSYLDKILTDGLKKARSVSQKTLKEVYRAVGLG